MFRITSDHFVITFEATLDCPYDIGAGEFTTCHKCIVSNAMRAISPPLLNLFQLNFSFPRPLAICWSDNITPDNFVIFQGQEPGWVRLDLRCLNSA